MSDSVITCERDVDVRLVALSKEEMICGMLERYTWEDMMIVAQYSVIKDCKQAYRLELQLTLLLLKHVKKHAKEHMYSLREMKQAAVSLILQVKQPLCLETRPHLKIYSNLANSNEHWHFPHISVDSSNACQSHWEYYRKQWAHLSNMKSFALTDSSLTNLK